MSDEEVTPSISDADASTSVSTATTVQIEGQDMMRSESGDEVYTQYQVVDGSTGEVIMTTDEVSMIPADNQKDIVLSTLSETETSWVLKRLQAAGMDESASVIISDEGILNTEHTGADGQPVYQTIVCQDPDNENVESSQVLVSGNEDQQVLIEEGCKLEAESAVTQNLAPLPQQSCLTDMLVQNSEGSQTLQAVGNNVIFPDGKPVKNLLPTSSEYRVQRPAKGNYHHKAYVKVVSTKEEVQAVVKRIEEVTNCNFRHKRMSKDYGVSVKDWKPTRVTPMGSPSLYTRVKYCHYANKEVRSLKKDQEVPDIGCDGVPFMSVGILSLACEYGSTTKRKGVLLREYYEKLARGEAAEPPKPPPVPEWKKRHQERRAALKREREEKKALEALQQSHEVDGVGQRGQVTYKACRSRITPPPEYQRAPRRPGVFPIRHKMHPATDADALAAGGATHQSDDIEIVWQADESTGEMVPIQRIKKIPQMKKKRMRKYLYKPRNNLPPGFSRLRLSKKVNCPVSIGIKQIVKFPDFKIPDRKEKSAFMRRQVSEQLTHALLTNPESVHYEMQYHMRIPDISCHCGHKVVMKPENYSSPDYSKRLLTKMYNHCSYKHVHLGDIQFNTEHTEKKKLHLHSLVLACASPFIHSGIEYENSYDRLVEVVKDLEPAALDSFLRFVYTGDLVLESGCSVESLKQAFEIAKIPEGVQLCEKHLQAPGATEFENWAALCGLEPCAPKYLSRSCQTYADDWQRVDPKCKVLKPRPRAGVSCFMPAKTKAKSVQSERISVVSKLFYPDIPVKEEFDLISEMSKKGSASWEMIYELIKMRFGAVIGLDKFRELVPFACTQCQKACKLAHHGEPSVPKRPIQILQIPSEYKESSAKPGVMGNVDYRQIIDKQVRTPVSNPILPRQVTIQPQVPQPLVINPGVCTPLSAQKVSSEQVSLLKKPLSEQKKSDDSAEKKGLNVKPAVQASVVSASMHDAQSSTVTRPASSESITASPNFTNKELGSYLSNWKPDGQNQPTVSPSIPLQFVPTLPSSAVPGLNISLSTAATQPLVGPIATPQGNVIGSLLPQFTIPALNTAPLQIVPLNTLTPDLQKALIPYISLKTDGGGDKSQKPNSDRSQNVDVSNAEEKKAQSSDADGNKKKDLAKHTAAVGRNISMTEVDKSESSRRAGDKDDRVSESNAKLDDGSKAADGDSSEITFVLSKTDAKSPATIEVVDGSSSSRSPSSRIRSAARESISKKGNSSEVHSAAVSPVRSSSSKKSLIRVNLTASKLAKVTSPIKETTTDIIIGSSDSPHKWVEIDKSSKTKSRDKPPLVGKSLSKGCKSSPSPAKQMRMDSDDKSVLSDSCDAEMPGSPDSFNNSPETSGPPTIRTLGRVITIGSAKVTPIPKVSTNNEPEEGDILTNIKTEPDENGENPQQHDSENDGSDGGEVAKSKTKSQLSSVAIKSARKKEVKRAVVILDKLESTTESHSSDSGKSNQEPESEDVLDSNSSPLTQQKNRKRKNDADQTEESASKSKTTSEQIKLNKDVDDGVVARTSRRLKAKAGSQPAWKTKFKDYV